jgi:DNA-binding FrmR family transcriptional regulator
MINDIKNRALHRAKILEGQMRGIQKMIDNEDYCMDILTQSLAIQKSIGSLNKLIKDKMVNPSEEVKDDAIQELLALYELTNIRSK